MAKVSAIQKNLRRKALAVRKAAKRAELKAIVMNRDLAPDERMEAQMRLNKMPRDSSKIRIRNRCEVSGRPHGYYRKFRMSRIAFRELASFGQVPGVTKASW